MAFNLQAIQDELKRRGFDGWLLYDHHHRDPIAYRVLDLQATMVTRRWYYFIPASGAPQRLVHRIEPARLDSLPGDKHLYSAWGEQRQELKALLGGAKKVAMQYSPLNNIPYVSLVDAGTVELVRSFGAEVISSADLIQLFESRWTEAQHQMHLQAGKLVDDVMQQSFARIGAHVREGKGLTEYALQQWIMEQFAARGLTTDEPPIVAWNQHSGDPHFSPRVEDNRSVQKGDWVLLDMWAKLDRPHSVFYDITWVGYVGTEVPARHQEIFTIVRDARDAAVNFAVQAIARGEKACGYQVDDAARAVIRQRGYADYFVHRTGHSIGEDVHSTGANMDNLETHDDRELLPGLCFSVEPGIYLPEFGVRSEVNVYISEKSAGVTGPAQKEIVRIPS